MKRSRFIQCLAAMAVMASVAFSAAWADTQHVVKKNESIYGIAYQYNISAEDLLKANPQAKNGLRHGMVLTIPGEHGSYSKPEELIEEPTPAPAASVQTEPQANAIPDSQETAQPIAPAVQESTVPAVAPERTSEEPATQDSSTQKDDAGLLYFVKEGDTLKSISQATGLSQTAIIELNPFIDPYALVTGTPIRLSDDAPFVEVGYISQQPSDTSKPVFTPDEIPEIPTYGTVATDDENGEDSGEVGDYPGDFFSDMPADSNAWSAPRNKIMLLLPFMTNSESPSKQASQYAEFYRGLLLAANQLSAADGMDIEITAIDIHNDARQLANALTERVDSTVAVIIAPEEDNYLKAIIEYATPKDILVYNAFNLKDDSYVTNPNVIQGYLNQDIMYRKAIDYLCNHYDGYTPVILSPSEGRTEKDPFVNSLRKQYAELGVRVIDLPFEGTLSVEALKEAGFIEPDGKYVFIPRSGSLGVFNRFAPALIALMDAEEEGNSFALFGYPDWTAFRGDALNKLYQSKAMIYTRFYYDEASPEAKELQQEYDQWYGEKMREAIPVQGVLGYDTGTMLIKWLKDSDGQLPLYLDDNHKIQGIQSSFSFGQDNTEGTVNTLLYIVKFLPSGTTATTIL